MTRLSPLHRALMQVYGGLWSAASPLLRRNKRLADGFAQRLAPDTWLDEPVDIWIQAASGGEARLACALVDAVCALLPEQTPLTILATSWTRQGLDLLERHGEALAGPVRLIPRFVPLDAPRLMRKALQCARPRLVVLLETEIWPGLLQACAETDTPVLILNGRLTERSVHHYLSFPGFWRAFAPSHIAAMSEKDAQRFHSLFPDTPVDTFFNIKFDQAEVSANSDALDRLPQGVRLFLTRTDLPLLLLASVREEEEAALCKAWRETQLPPVRMVIAPRHMYRIEAWKKYLRDMGLDATLRSRLTATPETKAPSVVLWDAFGELPALYQAADAVFVGGSLAPLGGQNFLEALSSGLVPFVGPHTKNFSWALDGEEGQSLQDHNLLHSVPDAATLFRRLATDAAGDLLPDSTRKTTRTRFAAWLASRQGGTRQQAALLLRMAQIPTTTE